jgi:hypothetical protein
MPEPDFHTLAKDAGNRLKGYVLAYASGATGVFFISLSGKDAVNFSSWQKVFILVALIFFVATVALCLYELHIDARRFFNIARQNSLTEDQQEWGLNERYKRLRVRLLYSSYVTVTLGTLASVAFLIVRIA